MSYRGPKSLRFRTLLDSIIEQAACVPDTRRQASVTYPLPDCYRAAFALFYLQDPSVLEFQKRVEAQLQTNNLRQVFGVHAIPSDSQLREILDGQDYGPLTDSFAGIFARLQRSKGLPRYAFYLGKYLITLDGSEYFNSETVHCELCLKRTKSDGKPEYYHQILQPAMVMPGLPQVIPLAPEFIRKQDGATKQDCETAAGKRAVERLRKDHPQLGMIGVGDSLYATTPFIEKLKAHSFSFLLVVKPTSHKSLFADLEGLRRGEMLNSLERKDERGRRFAYEWTNEVALGADPKSPLVNFMQLTIYSPQGKRSYRCSWVTDFEVREDNVEHLVRGARARWKIENEGFNTLKNQGYHLEHNFGHGERYLSETFFILNLLAFLIHQIFELVDGLYQKVRATFSARKEFWNAIRTSFRNFLYDGWDQLLGKLDSPPQPAFPSSG